MKRIAPLVLLALTSRLLAIAIYIALTGLLVKRRIAFLIAAFAPACTRRRMGWRPSFLIRARFSHLTDGAVGRLHLLSWTLRWSVRKRERRRLTRFLRWSCVRGKALLLLRPLTVWKENDVLTGRSLLTGNGQKVKKTLYIRAGILCIRKATHCLFLLFSKHQATCFGIKRMFFLRRACVMPFVKILVVD